MGTWITTSPCPGYFANQMNKEKIGEEIKGGGRVYFCLKDGLQIGSLNSKAGLELASNLRDTLCCLCFPRERTRKQALLDPN